VNDDSKVGTFERSPDGFDIRWHPPLAASCALCGCPFAFHLGHRTAEGDLACLFRRSLDGVFRDCVAVVDSSRIDERVNTSDSCCNIPHVTSDTGCVGVSG
jgi:hypothetical protein